jgi:hypothetical protein
MEGSLVGVEAGSRLESKPSMTIGLLPREVELTPFVRVLLWLKGILYGLGSALRTADEVGSAPEGYNLAALQDTKT